jgi:MarC family membrane protein
MPAMPLDFAVSGLLTLFVVVDPVGLTPTFLVVTDGLPRAARRSVALRASVIAGVILAGAALLGEWLFRTLGISLAAFRIAGGLLLFSIAFEMLFGVRIRREGEAAEQAVEEHVRNVAAFPLAIPLMAGPGAITATVLLAGRVFRRLPFRCTDRPAARPHRQYRAVAPARRAARRTRGAIRRRRRALDPRRLSSDIAGPALATLAERDADTPNAWRSPAEDRQEKRGCQIIRAKTTSMPASVGQTSMV